MLICCLPDSNSYEILHKLRNKHRHAMHAKVTFWAVGGLLETFYVMSTLLQRERRVLTRQRAKMSN